MTNSKYLQGDFSRIFVCHFGQDDIAAKVDQGQTEADITIALVVQSEYYLKLPKALWRS